MPDPITAAIITASATLLVGIISAVIAWRRSHPASRPAFSQLPDVAGKRELPTLAETPIRSSLRTPDPPAAGPEPQPENSMSPRHMMKTISAAPPLAREHVKQQFIGLPVGWYLPFSDALRQGTTTNATVYFLIPDSNYEVRCEVSLDRFPFLRLATAKDTFHIRGVVADLSSVEILLRDVELSK